MADEWRCPHCGTVFEKLAAFKVMEDRVRHAQSMSTGGPTNCPSCKHEIDFHALMTGKYDVGKRWHFWGRGSVDKKEKEKKKQKPRFEIWLRDPSVAAKPETLAFLVARLGRENDWDKERTAIIVGMVVSGRYKVLPDERRGGCTLVVE